MGFLKNLDILTAHENLRKESKNNNNLKKRVTHPHTNTHTYIYERMKKTNSVLLSFAGNQRRQGCRDPASTRRVSSYLHSHHYQIYE